MPLLHNKNAPQFSPCVSEIVMKIQCKKFGATSQNTFHGITECAMNRCYSVSISSYFSCLKTIEFSFKYISERLRVEEDVTFLYHDISTCNTNRFSDSKKCEIRSHVPFIYTDSIIAFTTLNIHQKNCRENF